MSSLSSSLGSAKQIIPIFPILFLCTTTLHVAISLRYIALGMLKPHFVSCYLPFPQLLTENIFLSQQLGHCFKHTTIGSEAGACDSNDPALTLNFKRFKVRAGEWPICGQNSSLFLLCTLCG
jgi:hypothetical protein